MNHEQLLLKTKLAIVTRFVHPPEEVHTDPSEESCSGYSINFTEKDRFSLYVGKDEWLITSKEVFFTQPNLIFRCKHHEEIPQDVCLSVSYKESFVDEIRCIDNLHPRDERPVVRLTNRLSYLHWRLAQIVSQDKNQLEAESLLGDLFSATADSLRRRTINLFKERQLKYYFEHINEARRILELKYFEDHSLNSISRQVGMSPFHFARMFKEITGTPPHKYLLKVRLNKAKTLLLDGMTVTEACFIVGFTNLSHFIRSFSKAFGAPPSKFSQKQVY